MSKARKEGREQGREEGTKKSKSSVILNGYDNGLDVAILSNITQLTQEEVIEILRDHGKLA